MVDDQPESLEALRVVLGDVRVLVRDPADVTAEDLLRADLVLVDLKLTEWQARISPTLATWPDDGLALSGVLRTHVYRLEKERPTSFAIYSSFLEEVSGAMPTEYRAHALARLLNLEWVFDKKSTMRSAERAPQFTSLALATQSLPEKWPQGDYDATKKVVFGLLRLGLRGSWSPQAWEDVEACHPRVHDLVQQSHGVVFLRWFMQRILPYPCFLWSDTQLAVRLGLKPVGFGSVIDNLSPGLRPLAACQYRGILSDFLGRRWWRAGVEAVLWDLTRGRSSDSDAVREMLVAFGVDHPPIETDKRIICLDETLRPVRELKSAREVVRIQPDDWPPFADFAWTTISLARENPNLGSLVIADDRERLASGQ